MISKIDSCWDDWVSCVATRKCKQMDRQLTARQLFISLSKQ